MNGNVHKSMVNSTAKMLPAELKSYCSCLIKGYPDKNNA